MATTTRIRKDRRYVENFDMRPLLRYPRLHVGGASSFSLHEPRPGGSARSARRTSIRAPHRSRWNHHRHEVGGLTTDSGILTWRGQAIINAEFRQRDKRPVLRSGSIRLYVGQRFMTANQSSSGNILAALIPRVVSRGVWPNHQNADRGATDPSTSQRSIDAGSNRGRQKPFQVR